MGEIMATYLSIAALTLAALAGIVIVVAAVGGDVDVGGRFHVRVKWGKKRKDV